jgi:ABC-2 type transport system ATP-binding protein
MLFSEEMAVLSDRFREVSVTLAAPAPLPHNLPAAWLLPETTDCVARFIHSEYQGEASEREVAGIFASARNVTCEAMPLRSIFLAIAKSGRTQNHAVRKTAAANGRAQA